MADGSQSCCAPTRAAVASAVRSDAACAGEAKAEAATKDQLDRAGMVHLPGGTFWMGNEDEEAWVKDGEGPVREVTVSPFLIDATAVSNEAFEAFEAFVRQTQYVTEAEHFGWSYVFQTLVPARSSGSWTGAAGWRI